MHLRTHNNYGTRQLNHIIIITIINTITLGDPETFPEGTDLLQKVHHTDGHGASLFRADHEAAEIVPYL